MPRTALETAAYTALRADLRHEWEAQNAPCWLCGQPIDYRAAPGEPEALDLDHVKPRSTHPHLALDRNNCRPAHARCNRSRGNRNPHPGIGAQSEPW